MGVAFAPTSCGVALAPTQRGGRGECDPTSFCVAGAIVSESRKDRFPAVTVSYDVFFKCYVVTCNIHFKQLPKRCGCYVVTSILINFQDALDATL